MADEEDVVLTSAAVITAVVESRKLQKNCEKDADCVGCFLVTDFVRDMEHKAACACTSSPQHIVKPH